MPFNILLLPLLGGYIFITYWTVTRFTARRYSGERLIIHSAIAGLVFLIIAFVATTEIAKLQPSAVTWWSAHVPFAYSGASILSFLLGALLWIPLNWFADRDERAAKVVADTGDFLEVLLDQSIRELKQVSITLKSGKVYIGFVTSAFDPADERKYMKMMPTLSGYRDSATHQLMIVQDYSEAYQNLADDDPAFLDRMADEFQLVLPIAEVASANLFDPAVYEIFSGARVTATH